MVPAAGGISRRSSRGPLPVNRHQPECVTITIDDDLDGPGHIEQAAEDKQYARASFLRSIRRECEAKSPNPEDKDRDAQR